jgi:hypothetical protein
MRMRGNRHCGGDWFVPVRNGGCRRYPTLAQIGSWEAFSGSSTQNRQMCGISTSADGKFFSIKYFRGDATFTIQLGSSGWTIANGARQKVTMRFDANAP